MIRHASTIEGFALQTSSGVIGAVADPLFDTEQRKGRPACEQSQTVNRACEYASQPYYDGKRVVEAA